MAPLGGRSLLRCSGDGTLAVAACEMSSTMTALSLMFTFFIFIFIAAAFALLLHCNGRNGPLRAAVPGCGAATMSCYLLLQLLHYYHCAPLLRLHCYCAATGVMAPLRWPFPVVVRRQCHASSYYNNCTITIAHRCCCEWLVNGHSCWFGRSGSKHPLPHLSQLGASAAAIGGG